MTKIVFAGGGTGGHIYPNIALFQELKTKLPEAEFEYYGSSGKLEEQVCAENKIPFVTLPFIGGMPRSAKAVLWFSKLISAVLVAMQKLPKSKPSLIFATGGYAAAPVLAAANILKIPYIIHNLDAHFGLANKAFIKNASALTLGFPVQEILYPKNGPVLVAGNPVRAEFYQKPTDLNAIYHELKISHERKTLVVIGGSQGAFPINEIVLKIVPELIAQGWQIIHQLGPRQYEQFEERFSLSPFYRPFKYLNNLPQIYSVADLAISRSGAMSLSELMVKRVPTIFIPLPSAAQNHQFYNAKSVEKAGACFLLEQKNLHEENLITLVREAYESRNIIKTNLSSLQNSNATAHISELILQKIGSLGSK